MKCQIYTINLSSVEFAALQINKSLYFTFAVHMQTQTDHDPRFSLKDYTMSRRLSWIR